MKKSRGGWLIRVQRLLVNGLGFFLAALWLQWDSMAQPTVPQPLVAIHVSESTLALQTMPASAATPSGPGNSGFEWWITAWNYHTLYETVEESLRADGTQFVEVSDNDIAQGNLLYSDGVPKYPIVISLGAEAVLDAEIGPLLDYVNAGGCLFLGSSALTRAPNGTSRGDFALADAMGVHTTYPGLTNWYQNYNVTKLIDHRLVSQVPDGALAWRLAMTANEIPAGTSPNHGTDRPQFAWRVTVSNAQVIAVADRGPLLTVKENGRGSIIYHAGLQPLIGHTGYDSALSAYLIFRNAIEWAFESQGVPIIRISPWRYPYDAAMMVRHDFENNPDLINSIEASARAEFSRGARGDFYFCTGALRVNMTNSTDTIASLNRAISLYGATIAPHNGGLANPINGKLSPGDYDYWHWGPDEVLDVIPPGYPNGAEYARVSVSNSFNDIEAWLGTSSKRRTWASPYFNSAREPSYTILDQLGVLTTGEQKLAPFPQQVLSNQTPGKRYDLLSLPTSDWYVGGLIVQSLEQHTTATLRACIDAYYGLGALINVYGHVSSDTLIGTAYIDYCMSKPRIWATNALGLYDWWTSRSSVEVSPSFTTTGVTSTVTINVSGATDPDTAIELALPNWKCGVGSVSQVLLNGSPATYRTNKSGIKIQVGNTPGIVEVSFDQRPKASDDRYDVVLGRVLNVGPPGLLGNDHAALGGALRAVAVTAPSHGTLGLDTNGAFAYTPNIGFAGVDTFTYKVNDGILDSPVATVTLTTVIRSNLFADDFSGIANSATVSPWNAQNGGWTITNGALQGTVVPNSYSSVYRSGNWQNYTIEGMIQFTPGDYQVAGFGGRLNLTTGARYIAMICPQGSIDSQAILRLGKFHDWYSWGWIPMSEVILPPVGSTAHSLKMTFHASEIIVAIDGTNLIDTCDNNFDGLPVLSSGGVTLDLFPGSTSSQIMVSNVSVAISQSITSLPALTVRPDNQRRSYGQANPPLSGALVGMLSGDGISASYSTPATTNSGVGTYPIVATLIDPNGRLGNYKVLTTNAALTVTQAVLTVEAAALDKTYNQGSAAEVVLSDNRVPGDDLTVTYSGADFVEVNAGLAKPVIVRGVEMHGGATTNYYLASTNISTVGNIIPRPLTVTAVGRNKVYDGTSAALAVLTDDRLAGDDLAVGYSSANFVDPNVGIAKTINVGGIIVGGVAMSNYTANASAVATADITPAPLRVKADDQTKIYGSTNFDFTATFTGLVAGETRAEAVAGTPKLETAALADSPIGSYPITISAGTLSAPNYTMSFIDGALTVAAAPLVVRAQDASRAFGETNPAFAATISGWTTSDTNQVSGILSFTTDAQTNSPVGVYDVIPSGLSATNYSITFSNGVLTIGPHDLIVKADDQSRTYGAENPPLTGTIDGLQNNDAITATFTTTADTSSSVGVYEIAPVISDPAHRLTNYTLTAVNGKLTITAALSALALASTQNPSLQSSNVTVTAVVAPIESAMATIPTGSIQIFTNMIALGDPVILLSGAAVIEIAGLPAGSNLVTAVYLGDRNFTGSTNTLVQIVKPPPMVPRMLGIHNNYDGTITLTLEGSPGERYVVQGAYLISSNAFQNAFTNTAGPDGQWDVIDSMTNSTQRFYRAILPQNE